MDEWANAGFLNVRRLGAVTCRHSGARKGVRKRSAPPTGNVVVSTPALPEREPGWAGTRWRRQRADALPQGRGRAAARAERPLAAWCLHAAATRVTNKQLVRDARCRGDGSERTAERRPAERSAELHRPRDAQPRTLSGFSNMTRTTNTRCCGRSVRTVISMHMSTAAPASRSRNARAYGRGCLSTQSGTASR
jgi:hypothetical protein